MTMDLDSRRDEIPPRRAFASHQRQFDRFIHLTKWFVVHLGLLVLALYFFIIAGQAIAGTVVLALALGALGYGVFSTPQVARDVGAAVAHEADPS